MTHYDLVVVGAGSGNTIVDDRFAGRRVAIVEPGPFGGTCLNRGCIPSKMLAHTADVAETAANAGRFGVGASLDGVDWPAVRDRVFTRTDGVADAGEQYRRGSDGVDVHAGTCRFVGERRLLVTTDAGEREVTADAIVLATGSRPVVPDIDGLADVPHHTSDDVMRLDRLPRRLAVLGGGYVGSELAHLFWALGSEVVQLEAGPRLVGGHDTEVSDVFTAHAARRWDVRCGTEVTRASTRGDDVVLTLADGAEVVADTLLVAVGRRPNGDTLDLDAGGVAHEDGRITVDQHQRTSVPGVWALGDASSDHPLKHVANLEARTVQHNLLHPDDLVASDHRFVPRAVFADPQVASVGLTEEQAREQHGDVLVGRSRYEDTAQGWARELDGSGLLVKVIADPAFDRLVGAHLVGPEASSLVQPLLQAMSFGLPASELARGQYWIHPALAEVLETALLDLDA